MKYWKTEFMVLCRCDPHTIYKELWKGFDRRSGRPAPFLWTLTDAGTVLMRSREMPRVVEITGDLLRLVLSERKGLDLQNGDAWRYILVCNPTKADPTSRDKRNRGRRRSLIAPDAVKAWLGRKGRQHGFEPVRTSVRNLGPVRWISKSGHLATHGHVEVSGALTITDMATFTLAMLDGIGAAKSAGMGMMILEEMDYGYAATCDSSKTDQRGGNASRGDRSRRIVSLGSSST